jgi:hypothetical protein
MFFTRFSPYVPDDFHHLSLVSTIVSPTVSPYAHHCAGIEKPRFATKSWEHILDSFTNGFTIFHHGFPMVFPWFSHGFPTVFPRFPHLFSAMAMAMAIGQEPKNTVEMSEVISISQADWSLVWDAMCFFF